MDKLYFEHVETIFFTYTSMIFQHIRIFEVSTLKLKKKIQLRKIENTQV